MSCLCMSCSEKNNELFSKTDNFVESLQTTYDSYGIMNIDEFSEKTSDSLYAVTPIGRLINVKLLIPSEVSEYEKLKTELSNHYKNDKRVNDVYICAAGTIMIDCRTNK
ncbi:ABC transporter [Flavobacterium crassostreae]|nr:ABC transporter [Flavobacterium crassostreae]